MDLIELLTLIVKSVLKSIGLFIAVCLILKCVEWFMKF